MPSIAAVPLTKPWFRGLANIRGRLRAAYGTAASLSLHLNQPRGVVADCSMAPDERKSFQPSQIR